MLVTLWDWRVIRSFFELLLNDFDPFCFGFTIVSQFDF